MQSQQAAELQIRGLAYSSSPVKHFVHLDALRGIAILGVLILHASQFSAIGGVLSLAAMAGIRGVQLFYMVSAFTLFMSLDGRSTEHFPISNFFIRRFFRIAPLFYLCFLASWLDYHIVIRPLPPSNLDYWLTPLFLFGFKASAINHVVVGGWSIAVETTFYAILPLLHRWITTLRSALIAYAASLLIVTPLSFVLARSYPEMEQYFSLFWFPVELPVFLCGTVVYFAWKSLKITHNRAANGTRLRSGILLIAAAIVLLSSHLSHRIGTAAHLPLDTVALTLFFLAITLYPWFAFINPVTRYLGKISYSLYLGHFWVWEILFLVNRRLQHGNATTFFGFPFGRTITFAAFFLILTIFAVPLSVLSWKLIEQPGILLGRRIIAARENRRTQKINPLPDLTSPWIPRTPSFDFKLGLPPAIMFGWNVLQIDLGFTG
jgi:peptidoglycan/LPS O-acetylase OafA/YrhL